MGKYSSISSSVISGREYAKIAGRFETTPGVSEIVTRTQDLRRTVPVNFCFKPHVGNGNRRLDMNKKPGVRDEIKATRSPGVDGQN